MRAQSRAWLGLGVAGAVLVAGLGTACDGGGTAGTGGTGGTAGQGGGGTGGVGGVGGVGGTGGTGGVAGGGGTGGAPICTATADGATRGSPIALTPDDGRLVVANRDVGTVSIFNVAYPDANNATVTKFGAELAMGAEPWQVAIDACGEHAFVVSRKDQKVTRIDDLNGEPAVGLSATVGSEPTALALSPNGTKLYVANWVDGTITVLDPVTMQPAGAAIDLNGPLVAGGYLGTVTSRKGLAHPRSIAISNNGDASDTDETIVVTEYFAQRKAPTSAANVEQTHVGVVYRIKASDNSVAITELGSLDTGFPDGAMAATSCFPNQLQSVTVRGNLAYVNSVCASPKGPTAAKNNTHPLVSVVDLATGLENTGGTSVLTKKFTDYYVTEAVADDNNRRFPHIPVDLDFVGGAIGYVVANGADAVFRVVFDSTTGNFQEVGQGALNKHFIPLGPTGQNPIGIAIPHDENAHQVALVANDVTRNVSVVSFASQSQVGTPVESSPIAMADQQYLKGKHFFNTGLGRWSLNGQAWGSCQSCHIDGLTDNVTWHFARGPRQSTSIDGSYATGNPADQRIFNWTGILDEMHDFEANTRGVSGGVGGLVSVVSNPPVVADRIDTAMPNNNGLSGSAEAVANLQSAVKDWNDITLYAQGVRSPRGVSGLDPAQVMQGETLFKDLVNGGTCQGCHGDAKWTISKRFYAPELNPANTVAVALLAKAWTPPVGFPAALLPTQTVAEQFMRFGNPAAAHDSLICILRNVSTFNLAPADVGVLEVRADMVTPAQGAGIPAVSGAGYNPPSLLSLATGAPYFHAGQARTLEELFSPTFGAHWKALTKNANFLGLAGEKEALIAYLLSIDEGKAVVPSTLTPGADGGNFCAFP